MEVDGPVQAGAPSGEVMRATTAAASAVWMAQLSGMAPPPPRPRMRGRQRRSLPRMPPRPPACHRRRLSCLALQAATRRLKQDNAHCDACSVLGADGSDTLSCAREPPRRRQATSTTPRPMAPRSTLCGRWRADWASYRKRRPRRRQWQRVERRPMGQRAYRAHCVIAWRRRAKRWPQATPLCRRRRRRRSRRRAAMGGGARAWAKVGRRSCTRHANSCMGRARRCSTRATRLQPR